jgi:hypothetical protein
MSTPHVTPTMFALSPLEHPFCPLCQHAMALAGIYPGPSGHDFRTFECPRCAHTETVLVDNALKSEAAGRGAGESERP